MNFQVIRKVLISILKGFCILIVLYAIVYNTLEIKFTKDTIENVHFKLAKIIDGIEADNINNLVDIAKDIQEVKTKIKNLQIHEVDYYKLLNSNVYVQGFYGQGAGTVIKKTETQMYILTCYHIIEDIINWSENGFSIVPTIGYTKSDSLHKFAGLVSYPAEVVKYDKEVDLALLRTTLIDDSLVCIDIATEEPKKGDPIYSVGNPLGLLRTVSKGIISNIQEKFYISDNTTTFGNSGGGLFNKHMELIGVPAQVLVYTDDNGIIKVPESGLGFSINLPTIEKFLEGVLYE